MDQARTVFITGASSGLGEAIAECCCAAGHRVVLVARRADRLEALAARLAAPDRVLVVPADVSDPEQIHAAVRAAEERFGPIDVMVANAGVGRSGRFADSTDADLQWIYQVNLFAVVRCCREVLPGMLSRGRGHLITVASTAGEIPSPLMVLYASSKAAVTAFATGLRRELRGTGVHVTNILPGFIRSEMTEGVPFPMPPARVVGDLVVRLIRSPRPRAVIPRWYGAVIWFARFFPGLVDWVAPRWMARLDPRRDQPDSGGGVADR